MIYQIVNIKNGCCLWKKCWLPNLMSDGNISATGHPKPFKKEGNKHSREFHILQKVSIIRLNGYYHLLIDFFEKKFNIHSLIHTYTLHTFIAWCVRFQLYFHIENPEHSDYCNAKRNDFMASSQFLCAMTWFHIFIFGFSTNFLNVRQMLLSDDDAMYLIIIWVNNKDYRDSQTMNLILDIFVDSPRLSNWNDWICFVSFLLKSAKVWFFFWMKLKRHWKCHNVQPRNSLKFK